MAIRMSSDNVEPVERHPFSKIDTNSSIQPNLTDKAMCLSPSSTPFPTIDIYDSSIPSESTHSKNMPSPSRQSSIGSIESSMPSASSLASFQSQSMLPPSTLGSALGINTSSTHSSSSASSTSTTTNYIAPRKGHRSGNKQSNSAPPPVWARRPSLPSMPSMGNRMSIASIASFDSLPEGESVPRFSVSPLGKTSQIQHDTIGDDEAIAGPSTLKGPPSDATAPEPSPSPPVEDFKKRKHLAMELLSTEHAYVTSLRLINDAYYQPLAALSRGVPSSKVESMSTASPVLSRKAISETFSNFVDILHLNQELFSRLDDRLSGRSRNTPSSRPASVATTPDVLEDQGKPWDPESDFIGDLLVPMAPFLKMYSLYVKNFSSALARIESERKSNESFARFLRETEKATWGRAGGFGYGLGFQAHLLTIVQRIPRYKLLVGDLVRYTPTTHKDYVDLTKAYAVIEKVAESINDNIRQHEVVVVMLGLQRSLLGLSEPLIVPGRSLLKRGSLLKACRKNIQAREFFLFTDCLVYAAPISGSIDAASAAWQAFSRYGSSDNLALLSPVAGSGSPKFPERPSYMSESRAHGSSDNIRDKSRTRIRTMSGPSPYDSKRTSMSLENQQLQFRGKFSLQDCTVVAVDDVVSPEPWLRHCLEIRTPGKSFAVYAETLEVKSQWLSAIRNAREEWVSNRRTLHAEEDSIQAKRDRRRSLQVGLISQRPSAPVRKSSVIMDNPSTTSIPEGEGSEMMREVLSQAASTVSTPVSQSESHSQGLDKSKALKVLEEYNAPVWVPDSRADRCACCNEQFGIWRRKHHCRLCGQVVCWACSSKTFLIASYEEGEEDRPARACDVCYESVFPEPAEPSVFLNHKKIEVEEDTRPAMGRPNSEVSLNTPSTPTSSAYTQTDKTDCNDCLESGPDMDLGMSALSITAAAPFPRLPSSKVGSKYNRAGGAETQLFTSDNLLSPQVQAATSGQGTFRLVTPRLTTPEGEHPSSALALNKSASNGDFPSSGTDYFTGVQLGQSELNNHQVPRLKRKKPLSAAARLSSVYGAGLTSPPLTNLSKS
jgi:hypothetical protein